MPHNLEQLLREAHRRSLWQITAGYLVASWIVYEVVLSLTEGLGLPLWVPPLAVILSAIGLPIILATALVQRGGPLQARAAAREEVRLEGLESVTDEIGAGESAARAVPAAPERAEPATGAQRLFTWNRAITGGVLAFALLGLASTGFMGMRAACLGPASTLMCSGELAEDAVLLLADFESPAPGSDLGDVVTEALRVDLQSSTKVRLADAARVNDALARMRLDGEAKLTTATARELAAREGYQAVLAGEVARLGGGYVLTAHVLNASDGAELAPFRVTARDSAGLIDAVDELSEKIRARIGESLKSARAGEPLERITTGSMEALRLYTQGVRALAVGEDRSRAVRIFEQAVEEDPEFAMAWRKLGVELGNLGVDPVASNEAYTRAFELSDRLPERERYLAEGSYHARVTFDYDRAIAAYERAIERFEDRTALNNVAILYGQRDQPERAEESGRRAMAGGATTTNYMVVAAALWAQGRDAEAVAVIDSGRAAFPGSGMLGEGRMILASLAREWEAADSVLDVLDRELAGQAEWEIGGRWQAVVLHALRGRGAAALAEIHELGSAMDLSALPAMAAFVRLGPTYVHLAAGDTAAALAVIDEALAERPLESMPPAERPYGLLATAWAQAGRPARARQVLERWRADSVAPPPTPGTRATLDVRIPLAAGDLAAAERALPALERVCTPCALSARGDLALRQGDTGAARAAYAAFDTVRTLRTEDIIGPYMVDLARILHLLGQLAEADGDREAAADYYARFIEQWEEADAPLQPRVEAARRRLQALVGSGG
ncbi:MAG: tetratricopeptide repeat protein [Gemmatimonadota bacterium]